MALCGDAAMVLFYDIDGDTEEHDDWHSYEHLHERLSIPGFHRATRWVAMAGAPRYLVVYEVTDTGIATAPAYLARLNAPTPWTMAMMPRFRGMIRGFCDLAASAGYGLGNTAAALRFTPGEGAQAGTRDRLAREVLPALASRRGMAGTCLFAPAPPPPMTKEQAIRGPDRPMTWLLLATAHDAQALAGAVEAHLAPAILEDCGIAPGATLGSYALHCTATAMEVARTPPNPPLSPALQPAAGVRR